MPPPPSPLPSAPPPSFLVASQPFLIGGAAGAAILCLLPLCAYLGSRLRRLTPASSSRQKPKKLRSSSHGPSHEAVSINEEDWEDVDGSDKDEEEASSSSSGDEDEEDEGSEEDDEQESRPKAADEDSDDDMLSRFKMTKRAIR